MIIHHYTNIETLALILNTQKLKFSRLDCVDDIEEGDICSDGVKLGKYVFVSCWTENSEESIPLWKMYANGGDGVRISMDADMFQDFLLSNIKLPNGNIMQGEVLSKIPQEEFTQSGYFICPVFNYDEGMFYRKIEYVEDVREATNNIVNRTMKDAINADVSIKMNKVGKYKHKRWEFQEESRFALTILPTNPLLHQNMDNVGSFVLDALYHNCQLPFSSYYMNLRPETLKTMTVTLSPSATEAQHIIVEALCEKYAPGAIVKDSSLKQNVNFK